MITQLSAVTGQKVRLREVAPADGHTLRGFDRDATRVGGYRHWAAHRADSGGEDVQFAIETLRSRMLVGSMWTIRAGDRFSYGIGIGAQHRRCGYAGDAITALLGFMFEHRGYDSCEVSIHGGNVASLSLHGVLGFREEGRQRDTEVLRGRINYLVLMRITAAEFSAPRTTSGRGRHWRPRRGRHWQAG
ncbi:GNAT family N-acetyltransferase [Allokutzneria sp. A3M-2-11 16]|uniref:GNAT family N-acetyltransferase n=1 Tax=Allokutzneria sp. A3M-2-11 16 TaxID=2962043 RepID=UPI0020B77080|nr:GNAT family protein [Allokutzneria sp. A3M-2-11 16]MCP3803284.1 GNAT family N-acetyltransferase [Allokutzneria sp. A3M-2-11 16]